MTPAARSSPRPGRSMPPGRRSSSQGKADYAAGQAQLAAAKEEYAAGQEKLARIQPVYDAVHPAYQRYLDRQAEYDAAVASGDLAKAALLWPGVTAQKQLYETQLLGTGYSIESLVQAYEAGQAKLSEGAAQIAAAEQQLPGCTRRSSSPGGRRSTLRRRDRSRAEQARHGGGRIGLRPADAGGEPAAAGARTSRSSPRMRTTPSGWSRASPCSCRARRCRTRAGSSASLWRHLRARAGPLRGGYGHRAHGSGGLDGHLHRAVRGRCARARGRVPRPRAREGPWRGARRWRRSCPSAA